MKERKESIGKGKRAWKEKENGSRG
jgi:hypothetical protein